MLYPLSRFSLAFPSFVSRMQYLVNFTAASQARCEYTEPENFIMESFEKEGN